MADFEVLLGSQILSVAKKLVFPYKYPTEIFKIVFLLLGNLFGIYRIVQNIISILLNF